MHSNPFQEALNLGHILLIKALFGALNNCVKNLIPILTFKDSQTNLTKGLTKSLQ